ncbi:MAG: hypothetical protein JWM68_3396, partial [Verrucomicrobiales bacterium]|nr:hypothetical protein [Verrucomicrobiales bacterium]
MKHETIQCSQVMTRAKKGGKGGIWLLLTIATLAALPAVAAKHSRQQKTADHKKTHYRQINLVSDIPGAAQVRDTNLVNAWGITFSPTSPFWIGDNGTSKATVYSVTNDASGAPHVTTTTRVVTIPGPGKVTGQLFNNTTAFNTNAFIFASGEGTISGWRPALGSAAEVLVSRNTALYTGIALATNNNGPILLLANFKEGTLDEYDASLRLVAQFVDRNAPAGYAPFNVQNIGGTVFVTYAKQDATRQGVALGRGRGLINIFVTANSTLIRFATGKALGGNVADMNSPWGVALAPSSFGSHGDELLIGNFGSGTIMSFEADGAFRGLLKSSEEGPVIIDGLWGLTFGKSGNSGVATDLYFTAG